jgi:RND family efflux transporter MFP subunit
VRSESNTSIELVKTGSVTRKAADEARAKQEAAEAQVEGAQARLGSAGSRIAEIDALIGFATMRAPFDGVVSHRSVDPGDLVRAAGDSKEAPAPLLRVAQTGKLRVVTHVPERDAVWVDAGDEVLVRFDALPGKVVAGTVTRTSGVLDSSTQRLRVEADIDNNDGVLLPGMFGQATISLEARPQALVIPPGSVRFGGEVPIVYVVEGGRISHREVELGLDDGQWIEVLSGLRAGDKVVKEMLGRLEEGAAVTVKQFP